MSAGLRTIVTLLFIGILNLPAFAARSPEPVSFSYEFLDETILLTGELYRPDRNDPAPAIVLMHGCAGIWSLQHEWAKRLQAWGYVALVLDSFGPRGLDAICNELNAGISHKGSARERSFDAYMAHRFLSTLDFVDSQHIGLIGWSHGGGVALRVATGLVNTTIINYTGRQFQSVVAFYPWYSSVGKIRVPLIILIGDADDVGPASLCQGLAFGQQFVDLVVYPNAGHSFDGTELGEGEKRYGMFLRYDPEATADAVKRVQAFFATHLDL